MPSFHGSTIGSGVVIVTPATVGADQDLFISKGDGTSQWASAAALGLMTNPMTTAQDLIVGGASGAEGRLAVGTNGQVLTVVGGNVAWAAASGGSSPITTEGDLIQGGTGGVDERLGIGTEGQFLSVSGGKAAWATASGGGGVEPGDDPVNWTGSHAFNQRIHVGVRGTDAQIQGGPSTITAYRADTTTLGIWRGSGVQGNGMTVYTDITLTTPCGEVVGSPDGSMTQQVSHATGNFYWGIKAGNTAGNIFCQKNGLNVWVMGANDRIKHGPGNQTIADFATHHIVSTGVNYDCLLLELNSGQTGRGFLACEDEGGTPRLNVGRRGAVSMGAEQTPAWSTNIAVDLAHGVANHFTISSTDAAAATVTFTAPSGSCAGRIILKRGATVGDISWAITGGQVYWMGNPPTFDDAGEANSTRILSWTSDGTDLFISSTAQAVAL